MARKRDLIVAVLTVFCLTSTMFLVQLARSQTLGQYDPWLDITDDGKIQIDDVARVAKAFGTSGDPINKTALLLDIQDRVAILEKQADIVETIRFYEPNETMNDNQQASKDAAVFVWNPHNITDNAILSVRCYFQYRCESQGLHFTIQVNNRQGDDIGWLVSTEYAWSYIYTEEELQYGNHIVFPNQGNYTIKFRFGIMNSAFPAYVKDINIILQVVDGLSPN